MIRPSFSALETFLFCERKLYFDKVAKLPQEPNHYMAIGTFYHAAMAAAFSPFRRSLDYLLQLTKKEEGVAWAQDVDDTALIAEVHTARELFESRVAPHLHAREIEQWSRAPYTAKIDLLSDWTPIIDDAGAAIGHTEEPCVIDYKTVFSKSKPHRPEAQLALYCIATGARNAGFCELFRDGTPPRLQMIRLDDYDLGRWRTYFDQQFAALATRGDNEAAYKLAAPDHPLCSPKFCGRWKVCPRGEGK